jgi:hypothetical protein
MVHVSRRLVRALLPAVGCAISLCGPLRPALADQTLWYNGDPSGNLLFNGTAPSVTGAVFDDFQVTDPGGWSIHSAWINGTNFGPYSTAIWSIRSGMASGIPGTVVAGGLSPTSISPGPDGATRTTVSGLNVNLAPGTYWLQLTPEVTSPTYLSTTAGANAVGTPAGNDGSAFFDGAFFGANFESTVTFAGPDYHDFSMGVAGAIDTPTPSPTPEPTSLALLTTGGLPLLGFLRRRKLA